MKITEAIETCRLKDNWAWSAAVVFSWVAYGAAVYFLLAHTGIIHFTYYPNEVGVISPTTIARVPKIARTVHFIAGTGFSALAGVIGWWLWLGFCTVAASRSEHEPQEIFSADAWSNLVLLIAFLNILYKFMPFAAAAVVGLSMLFLFRLAFFLHVRKKRTY